MPDIKKYLNRDGLDEYNSLLPHSSAEMQTYVNEWMDEHPEASTTVQDGAITERKLADKSVSLRTLADDTVHMLKGAILTGNLSGEVLTAADAYAAPPMALTVEGKSTQDGTPTPDTPVEIVSLEQPALTFAGRNLFDITTATFSGNATDPAVKTETGVTATANLADGWAYVLTSIPIFGEQTVTISTNPSTTTPLILVRGYDADNAITVSKQLFHTNTDTVSLPAGTVGLMLYFYARDRVSGAVGDTCTYNDIQLELGSTATAYQPYNGTSVLLNLTRALRSLPDGTHDTLSFAYLRPSTREGWAWYTPTLTANVGHAVLDGSETWGIGSGTTDRMYTARNDMLHATNYQQRILCTALRVYPYYESVGVGVTGISGWSGGRYPGQNWFYVGINGITTAAAMKQHFADNPTEVLYELVTPIITTLDPIELPVLPAPDVTVWADPSTGLQMEYVRDANIVIQNIEQAIADQ